MELGGDTSALVARIVACMARLAATIAHCCSWGEPRGAWRGACNLAADPLPWQRARQISEIRCKMESSTG